MATNNFRLIVVLGMHRSGTSAITRGLQALGVELGNNLMPPGVGDNDKGYWEDIDLNALNVEMLKSIDSDWHSLTPIQNADVDKLHRKGYLLRAVKLLQEKTSDVQVFGFKDPRLAKLLPFWKDVFVESGLKVSYVIAIRHPLSVSKSLRRRDGFDNEKSSLLWLGHVISSLIGTLGESCVLVDYDHLMQSPEVELKRIAQKLQLQIDPLELEKFKTEFLDEGLRHTVYQIEDLKDENSMLPLVGEVYSTLLNIAIDNVRLDDVIATEKIAHWNAEFSRLVPALAFMDKLNLKTENTIAQLVERDAQLAERDAQLAERDAQVQLLAMQLNEIETSKAWRAVMLLRHTRVWLVPPGSRRARLLKNIFSFILLTNRMSLQDILRKLMSKIHSFIYWLLYPFRRMYEYYKMNGLYRTTTAVLRKLKEFRLPRLRLFLAPLHSTEVEPAQEMICYRRSPLPPRFFKKSGNRVNVTVITDDTSNLSIDSLLAVAQSFDHSVVRTSVDVALQNITSPTTALEMIILQNVKMTNSMKKLMVLARNAYVPMVYMCEAEIHPDIVMSDEIKNRNISRQRIQAQELYETFRACDFILCPSKDLQKWAQRNYKRSFLLEQPDVTQTGTNVSSIDIVEEIVRAYQKKHLPKFSIISILYGKVQQIESVLHSYFRQSYQGNFEIIFVDDQSPDESVTSVRRCIEAAKESGEYKKLPEIIILNNEKNLGNCLSRNRGIQAASGDIIVVIDADCMVNKDFLQRHADAHSFDDCDVVIGPLNLETDGREPLTVLQECEDDLKQVIKNSLPQDPMAPRSFLNCITRNFSIKASFIDGDLFDPLFSYSRDNASGFGWEDVEMGYRLYKQGARIKYTSEAFSIHISHSSNVEEATKPLRSLKNFRRLFEKHPDLLHIARRWSLDTYGKISVWLREYNAPINDDKLFLDRAFQRFQPPPFFIRSNRQLKILTYRWHVPHQYELYKLPHEFTLITDLGNDMTKTWELRQRPLPSNAKLRSIHDINLKDYDLAILHFDENMLAPENTNGVIGNDWGKPFRWFQENIKSPKVAICHGTPQFYGQYNINYTGSNLTQIIEAEREKLVNFLGDTPVILNSYQAQEEWRFQNSKVIWHGFDPSEFPPSTYEKGIISPFGPLLLSRPHYRGLFIYETVFNDFPWQHMPATLYVPEPDILYSGNAYAVGKYQNYVNELRRYSVYFNPTLRSPMPRARGEAMLCGLVTVSAKNHDVELFIKNGWNGFYSESSDELRSYLLFLVRNPQSAREIGMRGRQTAVDIFNHDRYLQEWEQIINGLKG